MRPNRKIKGERQFISFQCTDDLALLASQLAESKGMTRSDLLRWLLIQQLEHDNQLKSPELPQKNSVVL